MLMNRTTPFMVPVDEENPAIIKDEALCSQCGHCFAICEEEIGVAAKYLLNPRETYQCIGCGQCSANCPEKAIIGKPHYKIVKELIKDPDKIVVFSTSPSVRVGFADGFGKEPGTFAQDEMVGALRALGADYVFDVTFSADLTIMEEGSELLSRILKGTGPLPQFTSCCPAWVKYMENFHPDKTAHLSSAKSPIGMQGAVIKTYFAHKKHIDPEKIISVAVTPCTAKKAEIAREELCDAGKLLNIEEMRDNDYVITTKELVQWCQEEGLDLDKITPSKFDSVLGEGTGAGMIFGNTGGVMEAALRSAYYLITGKNPEVDAFKQIRGVNKNGWTEAQFEIAGNTIDIAVVSGLQNTRNLMEAIQKREVHYHFVEVMACPGGCVGGGGQPIHEGKELASDRGSNLYFLDKTAHLRFSHENPDIKHLYDEYFGSPGSHKAHQLLHVQK